MQDSGQVVQHSNIPGNPCQGKSVESAPSEGTVRKGSPGEGGGSGLTLLYRPRSSGPGTDGRRDQRTPGALHESPAPRPDPHTEPTPCPPSARSRGDGR